VRIRPHAPRFVDLLRENPDKDIFACLGDSGRPNSGVVIFRGGPNSTATSFLRTCLDNRALEIPEEDRVTAYGENGHFIHFLKAQPYAGKFKRIEEKWNRTSPPVSASDYNIHYTGRLRSADAVLDDCIPFFGGTSSGNPATARDRASRLYYGRRDTVLRVLRRTAPARSFAGWLGDRLVSARGLAVVARGSGAHNALWKSEFSLALLEHPTTLLCRRLLMPGDTVVDGGGHVGYLSRLFGKAVGPHGRVLAIEAHPENAEKLRRNVRGLPVTVVEAALTREACDIELFEGSGHSNHSIFGGKSGTAVALKVRGRTLDELASANGISRIDLLKLDIEGAELEALNGAKNLFETNSVRFVLIELNPKVLAAGGFSIADIVDHLTQYGIVLRQIRDDYRLGPRGFSDRRGTFNYLGTTEDMWEHVAALLSGSR
jgi:FkbM family methyltransferase